LSSHAEGFSCQATGDFAHAEGQNTLASGAWSHSEGHNGEATNDNAHNEGNNTTASGFASHAEGDSSEASGDSSHAENNETQAIGNFSHAEGSNTVANGINSHVQGDSTYADGNASSAGGQWAHALRVGQDTWADGKFGAPFGGDAQTSKLVMRGLTPGLAPNETTELTYGTESSVGTQQLTLENGKYYAVNILAIGAKTGGSTTASFAGQGFLIYQEGGVATLVGSGVVPNVNNAGAGAASWSLTLSAGAGPSRLVITFATGGGVTAAVRIVAWVSFTEVLRA
jgi:hypothetical protein